MRDSSQRSIRPRAISSVPIQSIRALFRSALRRIVLEQMEDGVAQHLDDVGTRPFIAFAQA